MEKKLIIVGAGISGLSAGYYAQMNGFNTTIFEMHNIPGGLCTAWTRKGYTFDLSMHFLMSSRNGSLKKLWDELGITTDTEFHYHKIASTIEGEGHRLDVYVDREELGKQMHTISPGDSELINEFLDIYFGKNPMMDNTSLEAPELMGFFSRMKMIFSMIPMIWHFRKISSMTLQDFTEKFSSSFLRKAIRYLIDTPGWPMPEFPLMFLTGSADATIRNSGYPLGGSKKVVFGIARRFEDMGGKIEYKKNVSELIIEDNSVCGIRLEDGSEYRADDVIWAADGHHLLFEILKEKYMTRKIRKMYEEWIPVKPLVHVMFGVDMDLSGDSPHHILEIQKPVKIGNKEFKWIHILNHTFDKSTSPRGKSAIEIWYSADYNYWEELIRDRAKYDAEKKRIADETAEALDARWPGFKSKIEMIDVPTPMTYKRYTGNWLGSPDGWYITINNYRDQAIRRTLPGLKNFYMTGQWTAPYTGTVMTSLSGRQLSQILCKKHGHQFKSTL